MPIIISILWSSSNVVDKTKHISTIIIITIIIFYNILSSFFKYRKIEENKYLDLIYKCYNDQCTINNETATYYYRLKKMLDKNAFAKESNSDRKTYEKIVDFQTLSFNICESIYHILVNQFGNDIKCEVTLMKNYVTYIKMLAYYNERKTIPSSYSKEFYFDRDQDIYFVQLFTNLNGSIRCLPNKKEVKSNFKKLNGSEDREDKICQYIGIPIKTNKNEIEFLLQIDVSKENVFGKKEKQILEFAKNVLSQYAILLYNYYEQYSALIKCYDIMFDIESNSNNKQTSQNIKEGRKYASKPKRRPKK